MSETQIIAKCACEAVQLVLDGISDERHLCCCDDCQRRTGSAFGISWYYERARVLSRRGDVGTFERVGTNGSHYAFHFCRSCGTTVFWDELGTDRVGIAGGCIPAAEHIGPQDVVWAISRPVWYSPPKDIIWFEKGTSGAVLHRPGA